MNSISESNLILSEMTDPAILSLSAYTMSQLQGIAFTKTNESIYVGANQYSSHLYGLKDPQQIIGLNDYELKSAVVESADDFRSEDKKLFATGELYTSLHINNYLNGEQHIFLTKKIPIKNYQGKVIGLNCVANEITNPCVIKTIMYLLRSNKFFINDKKTKFNLGVDDGSLFSELNTFENEVLYLFNIGFSQIDIAYMENISSRQVKKCLESIKFKLKCSYQELTNICLRKNYHAIMPKSLLDRMFARLVLPNKMFESMTTNSQLCDESVKYKFKDKQRNSFLTLTQQQSQCLYYLLQGKGIKEISLELQLSSRTVEHYITDLRRKNGYDSTKKLLINVYFDLFA